MQRVWPNPANSSLFIQNKDVVKRHFKILNTQGVPVKHHMLEVGTNEIDVSDLPTGTYYVMYMQGEQHQNVKLLKR